ncbi:MAG: hypothetical protein AAF840_09050, partial [Bacteroidota bacterium]
MKRIFILFMLSSLAAFSALAQNPALYQQGNLTLSGDGTLYVQGDLQNAPGATFDNQGKVIVTGNLLQESDAALFTTPGTVEMQGSSQQIIGGSGAGAVNPDSLIINNPDTVKVARDGVSVATGVRFAQGILYLNENRNLDLGSSGLLVDEQESSRATGPGTLIASADLNAPSAANPGKLGLFISSSENLGSTTVSRSHTPTGPQDNGITRSYAVNPTNNQNLDASLQLHYFDAELNGLTESSLFPFTSEDGSTWQQQSITDQATDQNYVAYGGLASLNLTTLSEGQAMPVADAGNDAEVCAGESVQIGGNPTATDGVQPYTYAWSPTEGLDDPSLANPTVTPLATATYTVTITDANGNTDEDEVAVTVNALPVVTFDPVDPLCVNSGELDLTSFVSPAGGTFSGSGISGNTFDPATPDVDENQITYTVVSANGCESSATISITTVVPPPLPPIPSLPIYCINSDPVDLVALFHTGVTFSGPGVSDNTFNPAIAGLGVHTITYSLSELGCERSATFPIRVGDDEMPIPDIDPLPELTVQVNEQITTFPTGTDNCTSGQIVATTDDPLSYDQPGSYTITWVYTDDAGNQATQTQAVTVESVAVVEKLNLTSECSDDPSLEREWRVTNPNDFDVAYTYVVVGTNQTENLIATPGRSYFTTQAI